jgi:hypothetical protein
MGFTFECVFMNTHYYSNPLLSSIFNQDSGAFSSYVDKSLRGGDIFPEIVFLQNARMCMKCQVRFEEHSVKGGTVTETET